MAPRARAQALAQALERAQRDRLLRSFNVAYRERRLQAFRAGRNYMPYATARTKLMQAIASAIAQGGPVSKSVLLAVFD